MTVSQARNVGRSSQLATTVSGVSIATRISGRAARTRSWSRYSWIELPVWRRTKRGLHLGAEEKAALEKYLKEAGGRRHTAAA